MGLDLQTKITNNEITYPLVGIGIHGNIPTISYNSEIYTEEEQQDYNELAEQLKSEILGVGGRLSIGAEHRWQNGLQFGVRYDVISHWTQVFSADYGSELLFFTWSEGVVTLGWHL